MRTCERCGYTGSDGEIKHCPSFSNKWKGKYICKNCFKILRDHKNGKHINEKVQCPYCGSPVKKFINICPICHHKFKKDFFKKYEDSSLDIDEIYKEEDTKPKQEFKNTMISSGMKFFLVFFVIIFLVMFIGFYSAGFNIFGPEGASALLSNGNNVDDIYGTWELDSATWPDSNTFNMYWTFYGNDSVKIVRTLDNRDKLDLEDRHKSTEWSLYDMKDGKLSVFFFSEDKHDWWEKKGISELMKFDCNIKNGNKVLDLGYNYHMDVDLVFVKV